jgi:hypothetical protein
MGARAVAEDEASKKLRKKLKEAGDSIPVRPALGKIKQRARRSAKDAGKKRGDEDKQ